MYITVCLFGRIKVMFLCARKRKKKKKRLSKSRGKKFKDLIIMKVKNLGSE